jgi:hypothetical protein
MHFKLFTLNEERKELLPLDLSDRQCWRIMTGRVLLSLGGLRAKITCLRATEVTGPRSDVTERIKK